MGMCIISAFCCMHWIHSRIISHLGRRPLILPHLTVNYWSISVPLATYRLNNFFADRSFASGGCHSFRQHQAPRNKRCWAERHAKGEEKSPCFSLIAHAYRYQVHDWLFGTSSSRFSIVAQKTLSVLENGQHFLLGWLCKTRQQRRRNSRATTTITSITADRDFLISFLLLCRCVVHMVSLTLWLSCVCCCCCSLFTYILYRALHTMCTRYYLLFAAKIKAEEAMQHMYVVACCV